MQEAGTGYITTSLPNRERPHQSLGYLTQAPVHFQQQMKDLRVNNLSRTRYLSALLIVLLLLPAFLLEVWLISIVEMNASQPVSPDSVKSVYGVNVDMATMIPDTPYTVMTAKGGNFFDLAAQLGINTLRITDVQWEIGGEEYSSATWRWVFEQAQDHRMKIILLLEGNSEHTASDQAYTLLDRYELAHSQSLWVVDLNNEPDVSDPHVLSALQKEAAYVRLVAPGVPITIGGWKSQLPGHPGEFDWQNPADILRFITLVDIVSPHLYQFEEGAQLGFSPRQWTQKFLNAVQQHAQRKPILLEEFGASNGLASTTEATPTGSPQWQASVYQGVLQEVAAEHNQGVIGAVAWIIAPRPAFPDTYEGDMTGWAFVLNHGRRLLPAADVFSAAEGDTQAQTFQ